jgi:taurine dioxygenase
MLTIEPTGAVLGATARGIDLGRPLSERSLGQILLALGRYGVLRFSVPITSPRPRRDIHH